MRRGYFAILLIVLISFCDNSFSQTDAKFTAATYFKYKDYVRALDKYLELYKEDPTNIETNLKIGICYLNINHDRTQSLPYLKFVLDKGEFDDDLYMYLGRSYMYAYDFDEAIKYFNKFKGGDKNYDKHDKAEFLLKNCENAKAFMKIPLDVTIENLGPKVNTEYPDYFPFISEKSKILYFTSSREKNVRKRKSSLGYYTSDIYYSDFKNGEWEKASTIGNVVNTIEDEQCVYVTPDGQQMILSLDNENSFGDLFSTTPVRTGIFSKVLVFPEPLNTKHFEMEGCITADGNTMFVTRKKKRWSTSETDIYIHHKNTDGTWDEGKKLSSNVNTEFREAFPIYDEKTATLYFASEGHLNMGGFDIFKAKYDSTSQTFGQAENLGYPINTPEDNFQISFSEDHKTAYTSQFRKEGLGDLDIYKLTFNDAKTEEELVKKEGRGKDSIVYIYVEKIVVKEVEIKDTGEQKETKPKKVSDIKGTKGLVYRVQIGVYSNPIAIEEVFKGIKDIKKEAISGGLKYYSGEYKTFSDAQDAKDYITANGVADAFIVAFYDNERISIQEAQSYENK